MTLTEKQRAFLEAPRFAVAATISTDGLPHQTVVWYALDGNDELVVSTPRGSLKHRHLLRDPRLSLCVEEGFRYVTVSGRVRIEEEPEAARAVRSDRGALPGGDAGPIGGEGATAARSEDGRAAFAEAGHAQAGDRARTQQRVGLGSLSVPAASLPSAGRREVRRRLWQSYLYRGFSTSKVERKDERLVSTLTRMRAFALSRATS